MNNNNSTQHPGNTPTDVKYQWRHKKSKKMLQKQYTYQQKSKPDMQMKPNDIAEQCQPFLDLKKPFLKIEDQKLQSAPPQLKPTNAKIIDHATNSQQKQTVNVINEQQFDEPQQVECQICAYPFDKDQKVPRILQCGHTFCQVCLTELRQMAHGQGHNHIQCPNCRKVEQVPSINSLPQNEYVFMKEPSMFTMNIFSPYEAAKRLSVESKSLIKTGERYLEFLQNLQMVDKQYEKEILKNYETEYQRVEEYKAKMMQLIQKFTDQVKNELLQQMILQRNQVGQHIKEIDLKIGQINDLIQGVSCTIEQRLQQIISNEQAYLHKQMQSYYNQVDIEESINRRGQQRFMPPQATQQSHFGQEDEQCTSKSQDDESLKKVDQSDRQLYERADSAKLDNCSCKSIKDNKSRNSSCSSSNMACNSFDNLSQNPSQNARRYAEIPRQCQNDMHILQQIEQDEGQMFQKGDEYISQEHFDKLLLQDTRTQFYKFNTEFEKILKFKPIRQIQVSTVQFQIEKLQRCMNTMVVEDRILSCEDKIRILELELDLKDYYDIKRPTVVFFNNVSGNSHLLNVTRYDILSDTYLSSEIKANCLGRFNPSLWNEGKGWTALSHPSNNSVFLINGPDIFLFDNQNELMLKKRSYPSNEYLQRQAVCYSEGFIYMLGGFCCKEKKLKRTCSRYNIVTEKWQHISPMIFAKENSAACAINEFQIIVAGGRTDDGELSDVVEIYDLRENTWKVFQVNLSAPRQLMTIVSAQKDRAIIIGGQDKEGNDLNIVEEIDFLKVSNSIVKLDAMKEPRALPNSFIVNDSIFVLGRINSSRSKSRLNQYNNGQLHGEKYQLKENKWKEFEARNTLLGTPLSRILPAQSHLHMQDQINYGPAALLYE